MNLKIGKYIKFALSSLSIPVFPIGQDGMQNGSSVAPPFVTYKRNQFAEEYTKDGYFEGPVNVSIDVVAKSYEQMIDVLCQVQNAMHSAQASWNQRGTTPFYVNYQSLAYGEETMDDTMTLYVCEVTAEIETGSISNQ